MIDIITIVFQQELYYLQIQARSIEHYIDSDKIGKIYVVVNDDSSVCDLVDTKWWGSNQDKVCVIHRNYYGDAHFLDGWESQQYYKLACAAQAESDWSMCLDAKTWFINKFESDKIFDEKGRVLFGTFPTIPVFKNAESVVEDFFKIDSKEVIGPGGVPFFFKNTEVRNLCEYLKSRGTNLFEYFTTNVKSPARLTEFMFYSGWIKFKHGTLHTLYADYCYYSVVNIADFEKYEFDNKFPLMQSHQTLTASLHRSVYPALSELQFKTWVNFLHSKNLIDDLETTYRKLNTNTLT